MAGLRWRAGRPAPPRRRSTPSGGRPLPLDGRLTAGATRAFTVTLPPAATELAGPFGVVPIAVDAGGTTVPTFLPIHRRVEYTPLRLTVAVPITLSPDSSLFGPDDERRAQAWAGELGPTGRLSQLVTGTRGLRVSWFVDPTLLAPLAPIPAERPTDPAAGAAWDRATPGERAEAAVRRSFAATLTSALPGREAVALPYADADVAAALTVPAARPAIGSLITKGATLAASVRLPADLAWPIDGVASGERGAALTGLYAATHLRGFVAAASSTQNLKGTPVAAQRTESGLAVLAYDDRLSEALADLATDRVGTVTSQFLLADSLALLAEYPSTARTVLLVAPRGLTTTSAALSRAIGVLQGAPWTVPGSLSDLVTAGATGPAVPALPPNAQSPGGVPAHPTRAAAALLNAPRMAYLDRAIRPIDTVAQVREDGDHVRARWHEALDQLMSARWRGANQEWARLVRPLRAAGLEAGNAITVTPETINFFAETGRLQVSITNNLDVSLNDVRVVLTPLTGWLRLDSQPEPVQIGPRSRATVTVRATALAAGDVPIRTSLFTPTGDPMGSSSTLLVRVYPTGAWIYWAIGATAVALLLAGLWRGRRRRRRNAPDTASDAAAEAGTRHTDAPMPSSARESGGD